MRFWLLGKILASIQSDCTELGTLLKSLNVRNQPTLTAPNCCAGRINCNGVGILEANLTGLGLQGRLTKLDLPLIQTLVLSHNNITGSLPSNWNLPELKTLDLSMNYLSGSIPVINVPKLEYFNLQGNNQLGGAFPELKAPLNECRVPSTVCYDAKVNVPTACQVIVKCANSVSSDAGSINESQDTPQDPLSVGAKVGISIGVIVVVLGAIGVVYKYHYAKPKPPAHIPLKILTIDSPKIEIDPDSEIRMVRTTDHYDATFDIISSYK
jgi:hypothetical protein